ncbi:hypothetical protein HanRHA438_Chr11g0493901 [Helianthus annuus]|nr:hypothetical protein HanRHA438_Chr11g0493901 [Helianthus annuus]
MHVWMFGWVGGKHACVDLTGVSPLLGLGGSAFTVGQEIYPSTSRHSSLWMGRRKTCICGSNRGFPAGLGGSAFTVGQTALGKVTKHEKVLTTSTCLFHLFLILLVSWRQRLWTYSVEFKGSCIVML